MDNIFSSGNFNVLQTALQVSSMQHKVLSNNIANVNTPNYKREEVLFADKLQEAMSNSTSKQSDKLELFTTNVKHINMDLVPNSIRPEVYKFNDISLRTDANNVDIDKEMAELAKNDIYYQTIARQIGRYFTELKSAIQEGRK